MSAPEPIVVYTDGACRGNPGPSGAGWVICSADGTHLAEGCAFLGHRTNNEAEYIAAAMGLRAATQFGGGGVLLRADSQLLVRQINGIYRVHSARIATLLRALQGETRHFASFRAEHVPRARNARADAQANLGIDTGT